MSWSLGSLFKLFTVFFSFRPGEATDNTPEEGVVTTSEDAAVIPVPGGEIKISEGGVEATVDLEALRDALRDRICCPRCGREIRSIISAKNIPVVNGTADASSDTEGYTNTNPKGNATDNANANTNTTANPNTTANASTTADADTTADANTTNATWISNNDSTDKSPNASKDTPNDKAVIVAANLITVDKTLSDYQAKDTTKSFFIAMHILRALRKFWAFLVHQYRRLSGASRYIVRSLVRLVRWFISFIRNNATIDSARALYIALNQLGSLGTIGIAGSFTIHCSAFTHTFTISCEVPIIKIVVFMVHLATSFNFYT